MIGRPALLRTAASRPVHRSSARALVVLLSALLAAALAACSPAETKPTQASSTPKSPSGSASLPGSATVPSTTAKPTPTPTKTASFNGTCDDLLPVSVVSSALGRPVVGKTAFVVGVPEPNIGRQARLNCRYGIGNPVKGKPAPTATLEIGVSLYDTAERANGRIQATIDDYTSHGARPTDVAVTSAFPGTVLTGYGSPTIVVRVGPRTVAITAAASLVGKSPNKGLIAVADAVLRATANFSQAGPDTSAAPSVSPSSSPSPSST